MDLRRSFELLWAVGAFGLFGVVELLGLGSFMRSCLYLGV